jgi:hypothetical protein
MVASNQLSVPTTEKFQPIDDASGSVCAAAPVPNSAHVFTSDTKSHSAFNQSTTSIKDVDRVSAMAPESARGSAFGGLR